MSRSSRKLLWAIAAILLLAAVAAITVPPLIRSQAVKAVHEKTGRTLALGKISFNPFTWTLAAEKVSLSEKGSETVFVSLESLRTRISPRSLMLLAPVLASVEVEGPFLRIVRTGPNRYNFSDLLSEKKKDPSEKPARFSVNNIRISRGSIDFIDQALTTEQRHEVRDLLVQIPFVSTLSHLEEHYIDPRFKAGIDGSPLDLTGKIRPFAKEVEVSLQIKLQRLDLPRFAAYLPADLPFRVDKGSLTTDLELTHKAVQTGQPEFTLKGLVRLDGLALENRGGEPLINLPSAAARITAARLLAREFAVDVVSSRGLELFLDRDKDGILNLSRLTGTPKPKGEPSPETPPKTGASKTTVTLEKLNLLDSRVHWRDRLPPGGFSATVTDLDLAATSLSTVTGKNGSFTVNLITERGETVAAEGTVTLSPLAVSSHLNAGALTMEAYHPYFASMLTEPVAGRLDLSTDLSYSAAEGLRMANGSLTARNLTVPFGPSDSARLPLLTVGGIGVDLAGRNATVGQVDLQGGKVTLSRGADGSLSPLLLIPKKAEAPAAGPGLKALREKPFSYRVNKVAVNSLNLAFTDKSRNGSPTFRFNRLALTLGNLTGPSAATMPFTLSSGFNGNGSLKVAGSLLPQPLRLKMDTTLRRIPLADFSPYFPEDLNVVLVDGDLESRISFDLQRKGETLAGSFTGSLGVKDFYSVDGDQGEDLLKWEALNLDKVSGTLAPFSLRLAEAALSSFYARVVVNKDGSLNLQQVMRRKAPEGGPSSGEVKTTTTAAPVDQPTASAAAAATTPATPRSVVIDAVTMQNGTISFADHHLQRQFATTMLNLGGRVTGLSSEPGTMAEVDLRGNLENHSPLSITGKINPLRDDLFLDLKVRFSDIELAPVTPYSGTYLGYVIDKGKLFLDLNYHIEDKKLEASNTIFLDQFTLGQRVESPKATSLPVGLAVALLKDRKGEIHLDLPLSGRTDDPKFSIWRLVLQVLQNLLVKAATSPFALLGALGGGEDFAAVPFPPGSARLTPAEEAKLVKLGSALSERPALKIEVAGYVDGEKDPEGYRKEQLLKKMRAEKFLALVKAKKTQPGQGADDLTIEPAEYAPLLRAVYLKEKFPKPRNLIGMAKELPDDEMRKLIYANTVVGEQELRTLARERATAVRSFLVTSARMEPERVFEKSGDIVKKPDKEGVPASRVEFGLATK